MYNMVRKLKSFIYFNSTICAFAWEGFLCYRMDVEEGNISSYSIKNFNSQLLLGI